MEVHADPLHVLIMMLVILLMRNVILQIIHAQPMVLDASLWDFAVHIRLQQFVLLQQQVKQLLDVNG
jgi:hypothetical protein